MFHNNNNKGSYNYILSMTKVK